MSRKPRGQNFSEFERKVLMNLSDKYPIVYSRETDGKTIRQKQGAWLRITREYNQNANIQKRLQQQLRTFWKRVLWLEKKNKGNTKFQIDYDNDMLSADCSRTSSSMANGDDPMIEDECDDSDSDKLEVKREGSFESVSSHTNDDELDNDDEDDSKDNDYDPFEEIEQIHLPSHSNSRQSSSLTAASTIPTKNSEGKYEDFMIPLIKVRTEQVNTATEHREKLHKLAIQREQLQIQLLEAKLIRRNELHKLKLTRCEELESVRQELQQKLHDLRLTNEKNLFQQRLRNEQELQQIKVTDYNNKSQTDTSFPMIYK